MEANVSEGATPGEAELVIFAIPGALKLAHQARQAYGDATPGRDRTLPREPRQPKHRVAAEGSGCNGRPEGSGTGCRRWIRPGYEGIKGSEHANL